MGRKGDLGDSECEMVVGARQTGLNISETADLLGFSHTTISRVYRATVRNLFCAMDRFHERQHFYEPAFKVWKTNMTK